MKKIEFNATCPICDRVLLFEGPDDFYAWRGELQAKECQGKWPCVTRERALAKSLFSLYSRQAVTKMDIHESSPMPRGTSLWLQENCPGYLPTGYYPEEPLGSMVKGYRNEDLENQTFEAESFDLVFHLDVMEHLFRPFKALKEIWRTLRVGGHCLFTVPTYPGRVISEQVAFLEGVDVRIVGEPEYHGNPQSSSGALVTWKYGYDLPDLIARHTAFDVEVRRWCAKSEAIIGPMTEVYMLSKVL